MAKKEIVKEVNSKEFSQIIKEKDKLIICDFYAEWCMPCLMTAPIMDSIASKTPGATFIKVNVDDENSLAQEYQISSIPCIVFIKDGQEVDRVIGAQNEEFLQEKINDYLKL